MARGKGLVRVLGLAAVMAAIAAAGAPPAEAADQPIIMKMSTATINDTQHEWIKMFVAAVEKDSHGRIKGQIFPASQLGSIARQIEGVQFGAIQGWVGPPEFLSGVDERFEVMSAPGIVESVDQAVHVAADPMVRKLVLSFGANKGLEGISLFAYGPSLIATRKPIHDLAELKGLKIRVLASPFQDELINRLGGTPVAMTLGDVLPAIQQGTIDGTVSAIPVFTTMHYKDAAKYLVDIGQPFIFSVVEMSRRWLGSLPPDLRKIVIADGAKAGTTIVPWMESFLASQRKAWLAEGGVITELPPAEHAAMMQRLASIGDDMSKSKPALNAAFKTLAAQVKRDK